MPGQDQLKEKGTFTYTESNLDTDGAVESVLFSEVSSFQRLICMQECYLRWEMVSYVGVWNRGFPLLHILHCCCFEGVQRAKDGLPSRGSSYTVLQMH